MEVMYQPESIYGYQYGGVNHPGYPRSFNQHSRERYSCYSYNPTCRSSQDNNSTITSSNSGKTLHSVLMGEVPAAYSHLTSQSYENKPMSSSPHPMASSPHHLVTSSPHHLVTSSPHHMTSSPHHMITSPHHMSTSPHPIQTVQTEPMDLSCKKSETSVQNHQDNFQPRLSPALSDQPSEFSMLRNLLSVGRPRHEVSDSRCTSPQEDSYLKHCSRSCRVTLAKKNMLPVSARVSDWLVKVIQFAKSVPEFCNLSHNDKITLVLNSWSRILLLYMAEHNFQFAVTPLPSSPTQVVEPATPDEPSMKSVEGIQTFIRKCQHLNVDNEEYAFLRLLVLFNSGYLGLERSDLVDQLNSTVQQLLQEHVRVTRPSDIMHYSHLLLCLPSLYGTNSNMIEALFCQHITRNTDMEVLLKEMLQNI